MRYYVGRAGTSGRGKLHLFPEDPETGRARLETVCSVESRVENLLRSEVREENVAREAEEAVEFHGDELCSQCRRRAGEE